MPARNRRRERQRAARRAHVEVTLLPTEGSIEQMFTEAEQARDPEYVPCSCYTPLSVMVSDDLADYRTTGDHATA